jgi:hypothetical protein
MPRSLSEYSSTCGDSLYMSARGSWLPTPLVSIAGVTRGSCSSIRIHGGQVDGGRWGRLLSSSNLPEAFRADGVAVLVRMALGVTDRCVPCLASISGQSVGFLTRHSSCRKPLAMDRRLRRSSSSMTTIGVRALLGEEGCDDWMASEKRNRNLLVSIAVAGGFLVAAALVVAVLWPYIFWSGNARWTGQGLWIVILASAALITKRVYDWDRTEHDGSDQIQDRPIASSELKADKSAFADRVNGCLRDPRIAGYFRRKLVDEDEVTTALAEGIAFTQATKTRRYRMYTAERAELEYIIARSTAIIASGAMNVWSMATFLGSLLLIALSLMLAHDGNIIASGAALSLVIVAGASAWCFSLARSQLNYRRPGFTLSVLTAMILLGGLIFSFGLPHLRPSPFLLVPSLMVVLVLCYILGNSRTRRQCLSILQVGWDMSTLFCVDIVHPRREQAG